MEIKNAVLYCHMLYGWLYHIFRHLINDTKFEEKKNVIEHKLRVLISSATFV